MTTNRLINPDRMKAALGVAAIHALLGYALILGLGVNLPERVAEGIKMFDVRVPPPPPPIEPAPRERPHHKNRQGAASPPNLKATPTEVVAPPPLRPPPPQAIVAAPKLGSGSDASAGAAQVVGPGSGSGGQGEGTGSGGQGDGPGGGDGTDSEQIKGEIRNSDYPRAAFKAGVSGTVYLRFVVQTDGRVGRCTVTRSSGNAELDETTCRLIVQRFRYRPARDARGNAVPDTVEGKHVWSTSGRDAANPNDEP